MKRTVVVVSAFALASSMVGGSPSQAAPSGAKSTPAPKKAAANQKKPASKVAPADEYFGHLKLSILGIRNTIKDLGIKAEYEPIKAESILGSAALTEDALHDWQKKYPLDTWIPKTAFSLAELYGKVPTENAQKKAKASMQWLISRYPSSSFSRSGREQIAAGRVGTPVVLPQTPAPESQGAGANPQSSGPPVPSASAAGASAVPAPRQTVTASPPAKPAAATPQPGNTIPSRSLGLPSTPPPPGSMPGTQQTQRPT